MHSLDAWLDYFESLGHEVDGCMSGEDLLVVAKKFQPDLVVTEYKLSGELDGLIVYQLLCGQIETFDCRLILVADLPSSERKSFSKKRMNEMGILGIVNKSKFNFVEVEKLVNEVA